MQRHRASLWAGILLTLVFLTIAGSASADPRPVALVTAVPRDVVCQRNGIGPFLPLRLHALLYPGDVIHSGPNGSAEILYIDSGSSVKVNATTTLRITASDHGRQDKPLLDVIKGVILGWLRPGDSVESPERVNTVVHGTEILLAVADDGTTTLTVVEGEATFFNPQGVRELTASQQSIAAPGQPPTLPVAVDVTGLIAWTADIAALPLEFELPPPPSGPDAVSTLLRQGQDRREVGDLRGALDAYGQALRLDDGNEQVRVGLALTDLSRGQPEEARAALEPVRGQPTALAALGLTDLHEGRGADAERDLRAALALNPHQSTASALLALASLSRNDLPDALAASQQAVTERPDSAQAQGTRAMALFFAGRTGAAEAASRRAVRLNPLSPFALLTEGRALLARHQLDAARAAYEKAAAIAPSLWLAYQELGAVYQQLDMPRKAEEEYQSALALNPDSADAHTGLGLALQSRGRYAEAESEHRRAIALDPSNVTADYNLAALLIDRGRLDEARQILEAGVQAAPARGVLYARLAEISLYRQDLFGAQEFARRAVGLLPDSAFAHYELGRVYLEQERTLQAEQEFRQATTLDPQDAAARYALGLAEDAAATGRDPTQPLGQIAAANLGGASSALDVQNLQTAGAPERVQAAVEDPTVTRVASRSYGDTQFDGLLGDKGARAFDFSYLGQSGDGRAAGGLAAQNLHDNGVRADAGTTDEQEGGLFGVKAPDSASGLFVQGQYERVDGRGDVGPQSDPVLATQRTVETFPNALLGFNFQREAGQETRLLLQTDQPAGNTTDGTGEMNTVGHSYHAELRHDARFGEYNRLIVGAAVGSRQFTSQNLLIFPPELELPNLNLNTITTLRTVQGYVRDEAALTPRLDLTLELVVDRLDYRFGDTSMPLTVGETTVGLPSALLEYRLDPRSGIRFRARDLFGTVDDFELLAPRDVFLFSFDNVPFLRLGGQGESYELEYDHTFRDASFLRVGVFQQDLRNAEDAAGEALPRVRFRSAQVRYEGILTPTTTFFVDGDLTKAEAGVDFGTGYGVGPTQTLSIIPDYSIQAGLQYLDRAGWFVQPSYAYQGPREETAGDPSGSRDSIGGFGVLNARVGKRWGLRYSAFAEIVNAFNHQYTALGGPAELLQPGRSYRVGVSLRF